MTDPGPYEFVSEAIEPEPGGFDVDLMTRGLGSMPRAFRWRGRRYEIVECLEHAKISSPEGGAGTGERYLRRQEFRVLLDSGQEATIYLLRQAPQGASRQSAKKRWFMLSIASKSEEAETGPS